MVSYAKCECDDLVYTQSRAESNQKFMCFKKPNYDKEMSPSTEILDEFQTIWNESVKNTCLSKKLFRNFLKIEQIPTLYYN